MSFLANECACLSWIVVIVRNIFHWKTSKEIQKDAHFIPHSKSARNNRKMWISLKTATSKQWRFVIALWITRMHTIPVLWAKYTKTLIYDGFCVMAYSQRIFCMLNEDKNSAVHIASIWYSADAHTRRGAAFVFCMESYKMACISV